MMNTESESHSITGASAPGRVCLYGEHQDYLGLPIIAAAIDLRTTLETRIINEPILKVSSRNIPEIDSFQLNEDLEIGKRPYKYLRAVVVVLKERYRWNPDHGLIVRIKSDIPVGSGLSSSAALLVAFTELLNKHYELRLSVEEIAEISYIAEYDICNISCGRMDQYSAALGELIYLETGDKPFFKHFSSPFQCLVIGDTLERRSADDVLHVRKLELEHARQKIGIENFQTIKLEEIDPVKLNQLEYRRVECIINIRDITSRAFRELQRNEKLDQQLLGKLLTDQHIQLRDNYEVSSPRLDSLVEIANENGALGAKLTGAGLAGCIVAAVDTERNRDRVVEAINAEGGKAYSSKVSFGVTSW